MHAEFQSKGKLTEEKALVDVEFGPLPPPHRRVSQKKSKFEVLWPSAAIVAACELRCLQANVQPEEGRVHAVYV